MEEAFEKTLLQKRLRSGFGYKKEDVDKTIFELCNTMSDLRQNHAFLLDHVKRYEEKEQAIVTAILPVQTATKEIKDVDKAIFDLCKEISDLRENHAFLLNQVKRYQEKEHSIATAILSAQTTAKEIVEAVRAEAQTIKERADAILLDAEVKAKIIVSEAEELAVDLIAQKDVEVARMEEKSRTIVSEAEKLAGDLIIEADAEVARRREEAEQSIAFASAYQTILEGMDGKVTHLATKHIIGFLRDLTATVRAEAGQV